MAFQVGWDLRERYNGFFFLRGRQLVSAERAGGSGLENFNVTMCAVLHGFPPFYRFEEMPTWMPLLVRNSK